ncbi:NADP-retinol dehydrogenase [Bertholletia excelsa]
MEGCINLWSGGSTHQVRRGAKQTAILGGWSRFSAPKRTLNFSQRSNIQFPTPRHPSSAEVAGANRYTAHSDQYLNSTTALAMFLLKTWRATAFGIYGYLNFTKAGYLEHSKKFNPEDMKTQIEGKNCVVTGANSGIGYATAECLASRGANVYIICRNKEKGEAARSKIQSMTGNQNVYLEVCDLSSVNEIKSFASRFSSKDVPVHVLVNNAGLLENNCVTTSEGHELNFAVNVLGTYTITELLLPLLEKASPDARVITVSSGGMYTVPLTEDLQFSGNKFNGVEQYARNKRVQVALTEKWAEMYKDKGIGFYSMHPGWAETPGVAKSLPGFSERFSGKLRTSKEGADTIIWLALQPKEKLIPGAFYFDRAEAPKHLMFTATSGSHAAIDSIVSRLRSLSTLSS